MVRTFLDTAVLIEAFRGQQPLREAALTIIQDPARLFIASDFLYLELMPKPTYFRNQPELEFLREYFNTRTSLWVTDVAEMTKVARNEAERCGLAAMDALHLAAAYLAGAGELLTIEKRGKAIHRSSLVRVAYVKTTGSAPARDRA
ncbi:MAG TPA: PIN domain-containing protein [Bryobacteraceae bacterium]|nr:PIN domain-containing protein [Bryobacteraceae bacterium]